jgi:hypothetical protein
VPPVVAEVIDVDDLRLLLLRDLGKRRGGLVAYPLKAPGSVAVRPAERSAGGLELVQVVLPVAAVR